MLTVSHTNPIKKEGPSKGDEQTLPPPFDSLDPDPVRQFRRWLDDAKQVGIAQLYALTLATTSGDNISPARIVLLREVEEDGFISYTNYDSLKGQNLKENPFAALLFY